MNNSDHLALLLQCCISVILTLLTTHPRPLFYPQTDSRNLIASPTVKVAGVSELKRIPDVLIIKQASSRTC